MLRLFMLVIISVIGINAGVPRLFSNQTDYEGRVLFGGAYTTVADLPALKVLVSIWNFATGQYIGSGVAINTAWAITPTAVVDGISPRSLAIVFSGNTHAFDSGFILRVGREIIKHPDCGPTTLLTDCVSLVRFCTSITPDRVAHLAPSLSPYRSTSVLVDITIIGTNAAGQAAHLLMTKNIGNLNECDGIPGFVLTKHACIANDPTKYATLTNSFDRPGIVAIDDTSNEIIGFVVKAQEHGGTTGEIVLHLETFRTFITNTAIVPVD